MQRWRPMPQTNNEPTFFSCAKQCHKSFDYESKIQNYLLNKLLAINNISDGPSMFHEFIMDNIFHIVSDIKLRLMWMNFGVDTVFFFFILWYPLSFLLSVDMQNPFFNTFNEAKMNGCYSWLNVRCKWSYVDV